MKTFTLFWLTGQSDIVKGTDIANAMNNAGFGGGSLRALDFYGDGDIRNEYSWNKEKRTWESEKIKALNNK